PHRLLARTRDARHRGEARLGPRARCSAAEEPRNDCDRRARGGGTARRHPGLRHGAGVRGRLLASRPARDRRRRRPPRRRRQAEGNFGAASPVPRALARRRELPEAQEIAAPAARAAAAAHPPRARRACPRRREGDARRPDRDPEESLTFGVFSQKRRMPIHEPMDQASFPWRPLGALLADEGLLTQEELEQALAEQARCRRPLGQILVDNGYLSGWTLTRMLAQQHGVDLHTTRELEATPSGATTTWRPLGRLLVEAGFLTTDDLRDALAEQKRNGRRLGEVLVARGWLSPQALAR